MSTLLLLVTRGKTRRKVCLVYSHNFSLPSLSLLSLQQKAKHMESKKKTDESVVSFHFRTGFLSLHWATEWASSKRLVSVYFSLFKFVVHHSTRLMIPTEHRIPTTAEALRPQPILTKQWVVSNYGWDSENLIKFCRCQDSVPLDTAECNRFLQVVLMKWSCKYTVLVSMTSDFAFRFGNKQRRISAISYPFFFSFSFMNLGRLDAGRNLKSWCLAFYS